MTKIYIDGDGCPVKEIVFTEGQQANVEVVLVTTFSHYSPQANGEVRTVIYVDDGRDAVDFKIVGLLEKNDILITQDYGLASLALEKEAIVLHHTGFQYTKINIEQLLVSRHYQAIQRSQGKRTTGPKKFSPIMAQKFTQLLHAQLQLLNGKE